MSINIFKCNKTRYNCKDDKTMEEVFSNILINQQALEGRALFHNFNDPHGISNISSVPYKL